jgi:tetratricopeptide (TPR) repeat protein
MFQLCVSQQPNTIPFTFRGTGLRVYSLEEALYHVFHHWRESVEDLLSREMIAWATELGLVWVASRMKTIAQAEPFATRMLDFLQLVEYFTPQELDGLRHDLAAWERRLEWERLKERADMLVERGDPFKALPLYKRALALEENIPLLNNIAVAYMQLSLAKKAAAHLLRARAMAPDNLELMLHYTEAAILSKQFDAATEALKTAETRAPALADIPFLHGLLAYKQADYHQAVTCYQEAIARAPDTPYYVYKLADTYKKMQDYKQALHVLATLPNKDGDYYVKEAEIHAAAGDVPASLRCMRTATAGEGAHSANLWAKLAEYYRHDYDWRRAEKAIAQAQALDPDNDEVRLESARVKKGLGQTRAYQAALAGMLNSFKRRYRADE